MSRYNITFLCSICGQKTLEFRVESHNDYFTYGEIDCDHTVCKKKKKEVSKNEV